MAEMTDKPLSIVWIVAWIIGFIFYGLAVFAAVGTIFASENFTLKSIQVLLAMYIIGSAFLKVSLWCHRKLSEGS